MIAGKTLLFRNADGATQQRCAGSSGADKCREICSIHENSKLLTIPYLCLDCWRKGWRNRLDTAYAPGEID